MPTNNSIRYLFSINTGRSGSKYLAELFSSVPGVVSLHEPIPRLNASPMGSYLMGKKDSLRRLMPDKIAAIERGAKTAEMYIETTHCFIKGFGWELPKYLDQSKIGVIILRRSAEEVAASYQKIGCTQYTYKAKLWLIPHSLFLKEHGSFSYVIKFLISYVVYFFLRMLRKLTLIESERKYLPSFLLRSERQYLIWYCLKIDDLSDRFKLAFPGVRFYELNFDELNDKNAMAKMLDHFGLANCENFIFSSGAFGKRINEKK
jgi:hypothetical protein